jgi:hypothetical protein
MESAVVRPITPAPRTMIVFSDDDDMIDGKCRDLKVSDSFLGSASWRDYLSDRILVHVPPDQKGLGSS